MGAIGLCMLKMSFGLEITLCRNWLLNHPNDFFPAKISFKLLKVFFPVPAHNADFNPSRAKRVGRRPSDVDTADVPSSDDENYRESGIGILEFSPEKAGRDVIPANYNFPGNRDRDKSHSGVLSTVTGRLGRTRSLNIFVA